MSEEICNALNKHGPFLKKEVYRLLNNHKGITGVIEEMPVPHNSPSSVDVFAYIKESEEQRESLLFECKKVFSEQKEWVFLKAENHCYRLHREITGVGMFGSWSCKNKVHCKSKVASDGYELLCKKLKNGGESHSADANAIHKAGSQISSQYCGYLERLLKMMKHGWSSGSGRYSEMVVPCIVTNATLKFADTSNSNISMGTGMLESPVEFSSIPWVVLQYPFASTPSGATEEFRERARQNGDENSHPYAAQREDIFIINSNHLAEYIKKAPWRCSPRI